MHEKTTTIIMYKTICVHTHYFNNFPDIFCYKIMQNINPLLCKFCYSSSQVFALCRFLHSYSCIYLYLLLQCIFAFTVFYNLIYNATHSNSPSICIVICLNIAHLLDSHSFFIKTSLLQTLYLYMYIYTFTLYPFCIILLGSKITKLKYVAF